MKMDARACVLKMVFQIGAGLPLAGRAGNGRVEYDMEPAAEQHARLRSAHRTGTESGTRTCQCTGCAVAVSGAVAATSNQRRG